MLIVVGEGFDNPRLDTLFFTLPISWRGTVAQCVGRLHRLHERKREVRVYDYADLNVPMLARCSIAVAKDTRLWAMKSNCLAAQFRVGPPESRYRAPEWKRDYAASVRRLIMDGVDVPLADLFLHAAAKLVPNP